MKIPKLIKLEIGLDSSANGILDSNEITSVGYVCNGLQSSDEQHGLQLSVSAASGSASSGRPSGHPGPLQKPIRGARARLRAAHWAAGGGGGGA